MMKDRNNMYPEIKYDKENGLAYILFSKNEIEKSIESRDELFVFDIDKSGKLVGIEILSVARLLEKFAEFSCSTESLFSPEMLPAYVIPFVASPLSA